MSAGRARILAALLALLAAADARGTADGGPGEGEAHERFDAGPGEGIVEPEEADLAVSDEGFLVGDEESSVMEGDYSVVEEADAGVAGEFDRMLGDTMRRIAASRNAEARRLLEKKNYPQALSRFREAHELDPLSPEIAANLGYIYFLLGNHEDAERLYRRALELDPARFVTHLNLADLLVARGADAARLAEAAELLVRARELRGNRAVVILRQARVAVLRGEYEDAERFYREYMSHRKPGDALRLEVGDFYRDLGRSEEALHWYRQIDDEDLGLEAAGRIWELEVEKHTRRFGWARTTEAIPGRARLLAARGRKAMARESYQEAERLLGEALALAPAFAEARADLGDLMRATERPAEAELEYLRALAIDHANAEVLARLGDVYMDAPEGEGRAAEAAVFFGRALDLRPDRNDLHLSLARALRACGDLPQAMRHVNRYLAGSPGDHPARREAVALKRRLEELLSDEEMAAIDSFDGPDGDRIREQASEALSGALGRARAYMARGEIDAAMTELRMLAEEERGPEVLGLESRILLGAGRVEEAARTLRESLRMEESQPVAHEQLGVILLGLGDQRGARIHLERAEQLGSEAAILHLARMAAGDGEAGPLSWIDDGPRLCELLEARDRLARLLDLGPVPLLRDEAEELHRRVVGRLRVIQGAGAAAVLLGLLIMLAGARRVWGGMDLRRLLELHPESGPDVQRVLSAVRHEVLKHNTMMLSGLTEAVENEHADAADKARHFRQSLFGDGSGGGVAARLPGYLDELRRIGRANRRRLNLKRRDAATAPLIEGFALLQRRAGDLLRYDRLSRGARETLLRDLRRSSRLLNVESHEAMRRLLERLRILEIDEGLLGGIFETCRREPSFAGVEFDRLSLDFTARRPVRVAISRGALEDVLANLMRNAIQSSLETDEGSVMIGVGVEDEVDPITGIESVLIMVRDRSRKALTAEMLKGGRHPEGGLGLAAELVSRYEGNLDLLPGEGGWAKVVVVKLPRAEIGGENGEEE